MLEHIADAWFLLDAGATADDDKVAALVEALKGKAFHELVAEGSKKLGGLGGGASAPAAGGAKPAAAAEKVEEEEEEANVDMGGLFGDEDEY